MNYRILTRVIRRVLRSFDSLASFRRIWIARLCGVKIGTSCKLSRGVDVATDGSLGRTGSVEIGDNCELMAGVTLWPFGGEIILHDSVFIGQSVVIYGHGGVEIGDCTLVSMHCKILSSNHLIPPVDTDIRSQPDILNRTQIGRDVWLGAGVTILGGLTIGDGCVIGAGAVVARSLPANSVAVGVPATPSFERAVELQIAPASTIRCSADDRTGK